MRKTPGTDAGRRQLQWAILLLSIAVVLPTVCLLWFMNQAITNKRLAIRQVLEDTYKRRLETIAQETDESYRQLTEKYKSEIRQSSTDGFFSILQSDAASLDPNFSYTSILIYDGEGKIEFPKTAAVEVREQPNREIFQKAWRLEFVERDYEAAADEYSAIAQKDFSDDIRYTALFSMARCLHKTARKEEAKEACIKILENVTRNRAASLPGEPGSRRTMQGELLINTRLFLLGLLDKADFDLQQQVRILLEETVDASISLTSRQLALERVRQFVESNDVEWADDIEAEITRAETLLEAEIFSRRLAEKFPFVSAFRFASNTIQAVETGEKFYALFFEDGSQKYVLINPPNLLGKYCEEIDLDSFACRFKDNTESQPASMKMEDGFSDEKVRPFVSGDLGETFPSWTIDLYLKNADIFDTAADEETALYIWAGGLFIFLILLAGGIAAKTVGGQIKLNRLKNDFIANVTHELKTPLASMRVLVDTLLEGKTKDAQQASEYLELISKENLRLSRLIDNFLTFSRMERNKKVFEMRQVSPVEIANTAIEAIQTKFDNGMVDFKVEVEKNLPMLRADKDAMVTVLINLLDNAYKYSYDDKQIALHVFSENGMVCFSVRDNGTGMSRRVMKKVFNRFYQADSSLSRRAEGTGLGLAIVKFILDAHKGKAIIESRHGKGSTFYIKIPAKE